MITNLMAAMGKAIDAVSRFRQESVWVMHHNDSDGLSSGAILTRTFERKGYRVNRLCLEKPYPAVLKNVFSRQGRLLVFADFAGRIAPLISDLNQGGNLVLILDHHKAMPATDPMVHNLDPELFGLLGDRDISAATTCYLFSQALDPANQDLAYLAVIGAVGDHFLVDGRLAGPNREVALEAQRQGVMDIRSRPDGEAYFLRTPSGPIRCDDLGAYLDTLGAAGYYQGGADMGVRVCLEGASPQSDRMMQRFRHVQLTRFDEQFRRIQAGSLRRTKHIQWFHVQNRFDPMGVKMIGSFCSRYKDSRAFDPDKYIAGFQLIPGHIPEFGGIGSDGVKISMRVPAKLQTEILAGRAPALDMFLPEATARVGGFSDACHGVAAATTVTVGKEVRLIEEMETLVRAATP